MDLSQIDVTTTSGLGLALVVLWELRQQRIERAAQELARNKATDAATKAYDRLTRWVIRISERLGFAESQMATGPVRSTAGIAVARTRTDDLPPDHPSDGVPE